MVSPAEAGLCRGGVGRFTNPTSASIMIALLDDYVKTLNELMLAC